MNSSLPNTPDQTAIFQPFVALLLLTLAVWVFMYVRRIQYILAHGIEPQELRTPGRVASSIPEEVQYPAYNLSNLSELPILFYAACLALFVLGRVDTTYLVLAWTFVALRSLHSFVHCAMNHVKTRFAVYVASSMALWAMVVRLAASVF